MNDLVNDTIWFKSPEGGEVKLSMPGYSPEEVKSMKIRMEDNGWKVVSHVTTRTNRFKLLFPYFLLGIVIAFSIVSSTISILALW